MAKKYSFLIKTLYQFKSQEECSFSIDKALAFIANFKN